MGSGAASSGEDEFGMISFDIIAYVPFWHELRFHEISQAERIHCEGDAGATTPFESALRGE